MQSENLKRIEDVHPGLRLYRRGGQQSQASQGQCEKTSRRQASKRYKTCAVTAPKQKPIDSGNHLLHNDSEVIALSQSKQLEIRAARPKSLPGLAAFLSPTAYFLLLLFADRLHAPAPPEILVASLFFLIPVVALLVCGYVVWVSGKTIARRIGWMLFTLVAMSLQFGVLLVIIITAITAAIGYAQ